jgi:hypothetical protein
MARKKKAETPKIGHNGGPLTADRKKQLEGYIGEVERWEEQKKIIVDDIGLIYTGREGCRVRYPRHAADRQGPQGRQGQARGV